MLTTLNKWMRHARSNTYFLAAMAALFGAAFFARPLFGQTPGADGTAAAVGEPTFKFFALFNDPRYSTLEIVALMVVLTVAVAGLLYALMLAKQVKAADQGTPRMQAIAAAVREGADAYLAAQFRNIRTRRSFLGNCKVTIVPTPSLLSMPIWPPCSRMMRCTIIRPSPWPPGFVV